MEPLDPEVRRKRGLLDPEQPLREPLDPEIRQILQHYDTYPLHKAAFSGHTEHLKKLLEYGFSPDVTNFDCFTPLHEACNHGQVDCAEMLIRYGAKVNSNSIDGGTPLCDACASGSLECVRLLLSHGAEVNPPLVLSTPLHEACKRGSLDCVAVLINAGAHLNVNDCHYGTPLHAATSYNRPACIRLLLQAGAAVNSIIIHRTALHIAAEKSYYEAACILLEFGANVYASNNQNKMPVELLEDHHGPFYEMLVRYSVSPTDLKDFCRRKIRSLCGIRCTTVLQKLNLPQALYSYLMHID